MINRRDGYVVYPTKTGEMAMKNNKEDRRVKYTKMVLKESLIDLLSKKDISCITIKQICEEADINRATFYTHYSDQFDLLRQIEDEFLQNVKAYIAVFKQKKADAILVDVLEEIFEYIKDNAKLCRLLLSKQGNLEFQKRIMMLIYDTNLVAKPNESLKKGEEEFVYSFIITGCVGVIHKWLEEGMKQSSRAMAGMIFNSVKKLPVTFE
ncbi:MAG: TetR-like C-terminal domain-containing protein [Clostridia bacterium]|nr:TetR-like C-terminal domain-containing protein [Clostridia bacterium]